MGTSPYEIVVALAHGESIVYLAGEIDFAATLALSPRVEEAAQDCRGDLLFDLENVTFIDSEGIKMLLVAAEIMRQRGSAARVVRLGEQVRRVFEMAGVADLLVLNDAPVTPTRRFACRFPDQERPQQS